MKKYLLLSITIVIIALIVGCQNGDKISNSQVVEDGSKTLPFQLDIHSDIMKRIDDQMKAPDYSDILNNNIAQFTDSNNEIDIDLAIVFFIDNIDLFVDHDCIEDIYSSVEDEYNFSLNSLDLPFTAESLNAFYDVAGTHNGYNFGKSTLTGRYFEYQSFLDTELKASLTTTEYNIMSSYLTLVADSYTIHDDVIAFWTNHIANTLVNPWFKEHMAWSLNLSEFAKWSDQNNSSYKDMDVEAGDNLAYCHGYILNTPHCRGCTNPAETPTISHHSHISFSGSYASTLSSQASALVSWVKFLRNTF